MTEVPEFSHVFQPLKIGPMTVKNRVVMAPVGPLLARDGLATPELVEWGRTLARGGAAVITLGESSVMPPAGPMPALNLGTDRAIAPLLKYTEAVHNGGALASIQLNCHSETSPAEMPLKTIREIVSKFGAAARRCREAGMDMVMVHGAHGQLASRFWSSRLNRRRDAYGGPPENRARFAVEILEAIRKEAGDQLAIEYRISGDEFTPDGLKIDEQIEFARLIENRIDLLHVSAGHLFREETLPYMFQPTYLPRGMNVGLAAAFKKELKVPVAAVGSLDLEMAEQVIAGGQADMAAMGRTLIADPDCVNKAARGEADRIRPCVRCNTCIDRTHGHRLPIRCAVNPRCGREAELAGLPPPTAKKKVVVVGGGPAGMEAARTAAGRGQNVVIMEKSGRLGGILTAAAAAPFKADMKRYLDWAIRETMITPGLEVRLATEANQAMVTVERPDTLIIAAGSGPADAAIPGAGGDNVFAAEEVVTGRKEAGAKVVVIGAGLTGAETALYLAQLGKEVYLIDRLSLAEAGAGCPAISRTALHKILHDLKVQIVTEVEVKNIGRTAVVVINKNGRSSRISCDTVVMALGRDPRRAIIEALSGLAPDTRIIGDCNNARGTLYGAVAEGFSAGTGV